MALPFLGRENQPRSAFELGSSETVAGQRTQTLRFKEEYSPRMIRTADDSPATGRFWIERTTGRIVKTELTVTSEDARGMVTVLYAPQPKLDGLWVPVRMEEHYVLGSGTVDCVATYTNFRHFDVTIGGH